ncbi:MAG: HEAT repeat domain-containing protein [Spirochaetales bacterium]|nr:HEAT repeat domain-containing protein [Spirochaetales bacterium]
MYKLDNAEKDITRFLIMLGPGNDEDEIKRQIQELDLLNKIEDMNNWNYCAVQIVPLLLKIITNKRMRIYHNLLRAIISLLGNLKPDGFISEYAFRDIAEGTPFTKEQIFEELKRRGYVENHMLSPKFKPMDENFEFDIDPGFSDIKDSILEIMLSVPKDTSTAKVLITLLKDQTLENLYPDIIRALQELGHPVAIPVLLELVQKDQEAARKALVTMSLRDIGELKQLLEQGITEDVWGNELKEKVFVSVRELLPFLLEALTSGDYSVQEKRLICFLFHEMGVRQSSDLDLFVHVLPALYEESPENCYVTKVLLAGGGKIVSSICRIIENGSCEIVAVKRFLYILGETGPDAEEAVPLLKKLIETNNPLKEFIAEILKKIHPLEQEKQDPADSTGITIEEVQKVNVDADPEDYVLY